MIARAKQRIGLKIFQRVVHPTHVPLKIKTEPTRINRMTDSGPRGRFFGDHQRAGTLDVRYFVKFF